MVINFDTQDIEDVVKRIAQDYITSGEMATQIQAAVSGKQDTLISGESIKTINDTNILSGGNLEIIQTFVGGFSGNIGTEFQEDGLHLYDEDNPEDNVLVAEFPIASLSGNGILTKEDYKKFSENGGGAGDTSEIQLVAAAALNDIRLELLEIVENKEYTKEEIDAKLTAFVSASELNKYALITYVSELMSEANAEKANTDKAVAAAFNDYGYRFYDLNEYKALSDADKETTVQNMVFMAKKGITPVFLAKNDYKAPIACPLTQADDSFITFIGFDYQAQQGFNMRIRWHSDSEEVIGEIVQENWSSTKDILGVGSSCGNMHIETDGTVSDTDMSSVYWQLIQTDASWTHNLIWCEYYKDDVHYRGTGFFDGHYTVGNTATLYGHIYIEGTKYNGVWSLNIESWEVSTTSFTAA